MFPNNYSFNPGVVLDPVTMTPMISNGGGSITVNPLGVPVRPEQKVWQKMFIKDIPQECSNETMIKLLKQFGNVKNFKRTEDNRKRLLSFCHFQLETGQQILRVRRLFNNIKILDKNLQLKISAQTENFIKQWMTIQKDQWKKKLLAPGMNQAKQFDTIEHYLERQDKKYRQKIQQTLKIVNAEVKKVAIERMRQQQRKEHPKQKQREKRKKQYLQELQRKFYLKQEQWLKRERQKDREYRKKKEKQRDREKMKIRRLERQMDLEPKQEQYRMNKFKNPQRRKALDIEEQQDLDKLLQENPPEPQQFQVQKKPKVTVTVVQGGIASGKQTQMILEVSDVLNQQARQERQKQFKKKELFSGWQQQQINKQQQLPRIQLNLPEIQQQKQIDEQTKRKQEQIQKLVPQNKQDLWSFPIDWQLLSKSVMIEKKIRPWLQLRSIQYMGAVQQKFIVLVQKKLLSKSHPDKIIKILEKLIDQDATQFVIRLWKTLVFQFLKLKAGLS